MSRLTERVIQVAGVVLVLYVIWQGAIAAVVGLVQANQRAAVAEHQLAACRQAGAQR